MPPAQTPEGQLEGQHRIRARLAARVAVGELQADPAQMPVVGRLDALCDAFEANALASKSSSLGWLFARKARPLAPRGLYVHGPVGRGKTMLMDMFFDACPANPKRRVHFHAFMQDVHERVHAHRQAFKRGETQENDPVGPVARALAKEARLICFDEFHVLDIADAMILSRLFSVLFAEGVVLVATSNVVPGELYANGLNRSLFLPFIDLLKAHCDVMALEARTDYRREKLAHVSAYQTPLGKSADAAMDAAFGLAAAHENTAPLALMVRGHRFDIPLAGTAAARFSFDDLCAKPLGAADYLELARRFPTVFIDHVPVLDFSRRNEAKRFIILIDVLYDNGNRLFLSAASPPDALYQVKAGLKVGEFTRTSSRLFEMTSAAWLAKWQQRREAPDYEI